MKYLVVSTRHDNKEITILAELYNKDLAQEYMTYWNVVDSAQHSEIHPILDTEEEVRTFLDTAKQSKYYKRKLSIFSNLSKILNKN